MEKGQKFYLNKNAIVFWQVRDNIKRLFKQHLNYAIYDAIAFTDVSFYFLRNIFWLFFIYLFIFTLIFNLFFLTIFSILGFFGIYSIRVIILVKKYSLSFKSYTFGLMIYLIVEFAKLFGFSIGLLKKMLFFTKKLVYRRNNIE